MGKVKSVSEDYPIWWLILLAGMALIAIGIYSLFQPWNTFIYLVKYTGITLVVSSAFLILYAKMIKDPPGERKWLVIEGVIDLAFAVVLIFNPFLTVIAFPLLIGGWIILRGLVKVSLALFMGRSLRGRVIIFIIGALSLVFGWLIISYPFERSKGINVTISIFSLLMGSIYVYDAIRFKKKQQTLLATI